MYKKICITNRKLVKEDYLLRIEKLARSKDVDMIILREKDLSEEEYEKLAGQVLKICKKYKKQCILHFFLETAKRLEHPYIHLPMSLFLNMTGEERAYFKITGVSTHSVEEALTAQKMGASYITASHIFATQCKAGLEPRGLCYLKEVVDAVDLEVYALGGICPDNISACIETGADGVCMMSEYMNGDLIV
ncbi:MAG: thiamine phosphate synthase [Lachnospiraceae bacterium]|nr:thiamine phosphate synthase [Lachnospiraceae bacterium]